MPKFFSPRVWWAVGSVALILAVASMTMLAACSLSAPGSSAAANSSLSWNPFDRYGLLASDSAHYHSHRYLTASPNGNSGGSYATDAFLERGSSPRTATTTTLASSTTSIVDGDSATFTAKVTPASGSGTPTGTVTFLDDTAKLGSVTLNGSGVATLTTTALPIGTDAITAAYGGDQNFAASTSATVAVSVAGLGGLPASVIIK
ncbi:MAG: Ig-like domain-containing protein [Candidatus Acidiferrales bacterium]